MVPQSPRGGCRQCPTTRSIAGTGDFNGDGKSDILWRDSSGNIAVWLMNGATVTTGAVVGSVSGTTWTIADTGDFDGNGTSDSLWNDGSGNVAIWFMNGAAVASGAGVGTVPTVWTIQGAGVD